MMEQLPDQAFESFIGKKQIERLRKQRLETYQKAPEKKIEEVAKEIVAEKKKAKKFSMNDFLNRPLNELK